MQHSKVTLVGLHDIVKSVINIRYSIQNSVEN